MRAPTHERFTRGSLDIKMTPMIDVVFLLLIFFICTANFQLVENILPTNLLVAGSSQVDVPLDLELDELEDVVVEIRSDAGRIHWRVNEAPYDQLADVVNLLRQLARIEVELPVTVDSQPNVPIGDVIDVYDLCRQSGFSNIRFAAGQALP